MCGGAFDGQPSALASARYDLAAKHVFLSDWFAGAAIAYGVPKVLAAPVLACNVDHGQLAKALTT